MVGGVGWANPRSGRGEGGRGGVSWGRECHQGLRGLVHGGGKHFSSFGGQNTHQVLDRSNWYNNNSANNEVFLKIWPDTGASNVMFSPLPSPPSIYTPPQLSATKSRFSVVMPAIFTAPPQNRDFLFKAPRYVISLRSKIAGERRFSLRLKSH